MAEHGRWVAYDGKHGPEPDRWEPPAHEHCWHGTGRVLTSFPAQHPEVCCFCGEQRTRSAERPSREGHGPFFPGAPDA